MRQVKLNEDLTPVMEDPQDKPSKPGVYRFCGIRYTDVGRIVSEDAIVCVRRELVTRELELIAYFFAKQTKFRVSKFEGQWQYLFKEP